ncbi:hypothetical protein T11_1911 [Trichinella zimbabwensis]|uniref:Uncharacterized protein n=1 Tax=Trichinella zimbabwensis TaxID=268475 RepID=A0A0V1I3X8_9BILA|nr:hypothetical protein T11_1911 [Trichinella zimbabwensis]
MPSDVGRRNNMKPDPDGLSGSLRNTARPDCMLYGTGPLLLSIKTDSGGRSSVRDTESLGSVEVAVARHMVDKRTMGEPMEDGARCEEIVTRIIYWATLSGFYLLLSVVSNFTSFHAHFEEYDAMIASGEGPKDA